MLLPTLLLGCFLLVADVTGHKYSTSKCPNPNPVKDFDESQILGKWRVEYAVKTTSTCFDMDFRKEGSQLMVYETKEPAAPEKLSLDVKYGSVGTLASTAQAGYYQASFSTSVISGRFVVLDTDYKTYMVVFHCMQMSILGSRRAVYVLSRDGAKITDERLKQVRARLPELDVEAGLLAKVSHEQCTTAEQADVDLTGSVNVKDVLKAAKKVVTVGGGILELVQVFGALG
ncbi:apolipoprotein D-like [Amphibalanus amphitrite]|uniref:apolipoprotein D-like n=1 Tax=Amphibalanus amphitrite TaxID=1232801 RepID=UPI001C90BAC8|nr:apolipoprotein D-like [Amphibalanus amphitrite]